MSTSWCLRQVGPNPTSVSGLCQWWCCRWEGDRAARRDRSRTRCPPPAAPTTPPPPPECGLTALTLTAQLLCGDATHTSALSATCSRQRSARSRGHPRTPSSSEPPVTPEGSPVPISSHCPHPPPPPIPTRSLPAPADAPSWTRHVRGVPSRVAACVLGVRPVVARVGASPLPWLRDPPGRVGTGHLCLHPPANISRPHTRDVVNVWEGGVWTGFSPRSA